MDQTGRVDERAGALPTNGREDYQSFWALTGVMFQGAFSDNIYRLALLVFSVDVATKLNPEDTAGAEAMAATFAMIVGLTFAVPWVLGATVAGWMGDRFSKTNVTRGTKLMEIAVMALAGVALYLQTMLLLPALYFAIGVLFLMSLQSTLFGPAKYGILPEILPENRIGWANGMLQGFTFLSIIFGTLLAPLIYGLINENFPGQLWLLGVILMALATVGYAISRQMNVVPAANPKEPLEKNPLKPLFRYGGSIWRIQPIRYAVAGQFTWWLAAIMMQPAALIVLKSGLGIPDKVLGFAMVPVALGMGIGCFLAGHISRKEVQLGIAPLGALGMLTAGVAMFFLLPPLDEGGIRPDSLKYIVPALLGIIGFSSGLVITPLQAFILQQSPSELRGGIWATASMCSAIAWIIGSILMKQIQGFRGNIADVFLVSGVLVTVVMLLLCAKFPRTLLKYLVPGISAKEVSS